MSVVDALLNLQYAAELASDVQNSELCTIIIQIAAYGTP